MFQLLSLRVKIALLLLAAVTIAACSAWLCWQWQANKYEAKLSKQTSVYDAALLTVNKAASDVALAALAEQSATIQKLSKLDRVTTEQRNRDLVENQRLTDLLANSGRVRVSGTCTNPATANGVSKANSSTSVDDGNVELSAIAGRNLLRIREGMIKDQAALKFFQERERGLH